MSMQNATPNHRPRYSTRYEVAAIHTDGRQITVGFTAQVSRAGLLKMIQSRGVELIELCEVGDADVITFATKPRIHATLSATGWTIGFTGRTELEAATAIARGNAVPWVEVDTETGPGGTVRLSRSIRVF